MMNEIRHIVFDIGKVLIHYDPSLAYRETMPDESEREWFLSHVCNHDWNLEQDRGRPWAEAEAILIGNHPEYAHHIRAFRRNWSCMVPHAYEESVALLEHFVETGHDVTMLTNFASDTYREAEKRFAFLKRPRGVTVSGDIGLIKPDREIYDRHARDFGLDPAATLFIDDTLPNVKGAQNAGWQSIHFTDPPSLKADLARFGLLDRRDFRPT